ncbi:MAG: hypothetical protein IKR30_05235 [Bacteroidales bacterium]|nr:hypothetical protein [Bacteroidales bacterium]
MTFEKVLDDKRLWAVRYEGPEANLDLLFKHLENSRFSEMTLGRKKAAILWNNSPLWKESETILSTKAYMIWKD